MELTIMRCGLARSFLFLVVMLADPLSVAFASAVQPSPAMICTELAVAADELCRRSVEEPGLTVDAHDKLVADALVTYEKALDCNPFDIHTRLHAADLYYDERDMQSLAEHLKVAMAFDDAYPRIRALMGRVARVFGQYEQALLLQREAVRMGSDDPYCKGSLAFTLFEGATRAEYFKGEERVAALNESLQLYRQVLSMAEGKADFSNRDEHYSALVVMGKIFYALGDRSRSEEILSAAIKDNPDRFEAFSAQANIRYNEKDRELARRSIDEALARRPGLPYLVAIKAQIAGE